jgi:methyl coenzyme M reductase subunit C-like uncharacterized protein (methanogenesis marker protein 7)
MKTTTFRFFGGVRSGVSETVQLPLGLADLVDGLEPDSATLEYPSHSTFEDAIRGNQVRIVVEPVTPASVPNKIQTYRNGDVPGDWLGVDANGVIFDMPRHRRGLQLAAERDGVSAAAALSAQLESDRARQPPGIIEPHVQQAINEAVERAVKTAAQEAAREGLDS